jgi:hypothetical protein
MASRNATAIASSSMDNPLFVAGEYRTRTGAIHNVSRLMLPLSDDGVNVNKVVFTRIARFSSDVKADVDWLKGTPGRPGTCASGCSCHVLKSLSASAPAEFDVSLRVVRDMNGLLVQPASDRDRASVETYSAARIAD